MRRRLYFRLEDVPCFMDVSDVASLLRISRSAAYELMHTQGFPCQHVGRRMIVNKERLLEYLDRQLEEQHENHKRWYEYGKGEQTQEP